MSENSDDRTYSSLLEDEFTEEQRTDSFLLEDELTEEQWSLLDILAIDFPTDSIDPEEIKDFVESLSFKSKSSITNSSTESLVLLAPTPTISS